MADFFEQMRDVIAEEESRHPGSLPRCEEAAKFFRAAETPPPVPRSLPPAATPAAALDKTPELPAPTGDLKEMCRQVAQCCRCPLGKTRTNPVFGEGNPDAELMFIGEGPGFDEDRLGRPFVGRAGQLLDKMIAAMQFKREDVYIANIVKCRPPDNRVPAPEEAGCCIGYLKRQIELVKPSVIVLLGATAAKYLLNTGSGISRLRGRWLSYENIPVMPTFHPAFLLRQESAKREAWQDLQQVMARFGKVYKKPSAQ